jgi:glycosyltransferase involved in cell wall biosynthesis
VVSAQVALGPVIRRQDRLRSALQRFITRRYIANADTIVAVSQGVAEDIRKIASIPGERIRVINNPVVVPGFYEKANEVVEHSWFALGGEPVILGVGQLKPQKDFATLIRAFAHVRAVRGAKLLILGEGSERVALEAMVGELGLGGSVSMPGYEPNPYKFMKRASVFVLCSAYEGCPLVLAEALAVGTPIVATNCEAGPAEILAHGRFGTLVPVGDSRSLATAILETLAAPPDSEPLRARGRDFSLDHILPQYIEAFRLAPEPHDLKRAHETQRA